MRPVLTLTFVILSSALVHAQEITHSFGEKLSGKYEDYELLGSNDLGIVVHHYNKSAHLLELYSHNLRPVDKEVVNLKEKKAYLEQIILGKNMVLVFYSKIEKDKQYLKVRKMDGRFDLPEEGVKVDSFNRSGFDAPKNYYVKVSENKEKFLSFFLDRDNNRLRVEFTIYNERLKPVGRSSILLEDRGNNLVLRSMNVSNEGHVYAVVAHNSRRNESDVFATEKYTVFLYDQKSGRSESHEILREEYRFKDLLTGIDQENGALVVSAVYQQNREFEDIGILHNRYETGGTGSVQEAKWVPFKEEDFDQSHSYSFRNWEEKASLIKPRQIISRSDGGYLILTEGEYQYTQIIRTPTSSVDVIGQSYVRYNDKNYFYDIGVYSIDGNGFLDWKVDLPKSQETEDDGGIYSSYFLFRSRNVLKFLFNEDLYTNGNFMEFNVNPAGESNRVSLLNSAKMDLTLVPRKGIQISGNEIVIPSEKRKNLQLVKIKY